MNTEDRHELNYVELKFRFQIIQVRSMPLVQNVMNEFCVDNWKSLYNATNINRGALSQTHMASSNVLVKILGLGGEEILSFSAAASRPVRRLKRQLEILTGCPVLQQVSLRLSIEIHWMLINKMFAFLW